MTKVEEIWQGLKYLETEATMLKGQAGICAEHDIVYAFIDAEIDEEVRTDKVASIRKTMEQFGWTFDDINGEISFTHGASS